MALRIAPSPNGRSYDVFMSAPSVCCTARTLNAAVFCHTAKPLTRPEVIGTVYLTTLTRTGDGLITADG